MLELAESIIMKKGGGAAHKNTKKAVSDLLLAIGNNKTIRKKKGLGHEHEER